MSEFLEPKYLVAAFNVIMLILAYVQGYKTGKRRATSEVFRALGVPKGYRIDGVHFSKVEE
jgi:hypothetical protein